MTAFALSAVGRDRPGIVASVAEALVADAESPMSAFPGINRTDCYRVRTVGNRVGR